MRNQHHCCLLLFFTFQLLFGCSDMSQSENMICELLSGRCSPSRRAELITSLETMHGKYALNEAYFAAYYEERPKDSWKSDGYFPDRCGWPRDIQMCWAAREVFLQLENGGLSQLLYNTHGDMISEAAQWYVKNDMVTVGNCLDRCIGEMGVEFRNRDMRIRLLQNDRFRAKLDELQREMDESLPSEFVFNSRCDGALARAGIVRLSR